MAFLLLYQSMTTFLRKEIEMVMDWLTAVGLVSALAAAVGIGIAARRGNQTRQPLETALPPRFRTLAAGDFRDNLEYPCREDLPQKRVSTNVVTNSGILMDD
jgi:hypothetical protein